MTFFYRVLKRSCCTMCFVCDQFYSVHDRQACAAAQLCRECTECTEISVFLVNAQLIIRLQNGLAALLLPMLHSITKEVCLPGAQDTTGMHPAMTAVQSNTSICLTDWTRSSSWQLLQPMTCSNTCLQQQGICKQSAYIRASMY